MRAPCDPFSSASPGLRPFRKPLYFTRRRPLSRLRTDPTWRLRLKGFGISIDDYGTGYSSMKQLTRIAFTELKVDQSFVMNAVKQVSARVILDHSLKLAKNLNITSVAEGVEQAADFQLLCKLHCNMAQGYFIARPMAYAAFADWVQDWKPPACLKG